MIASGFTIVALAVALLGQTQAPASEDQAPKGALRPGAAALPLMKDMARIYRIETEETTAPLQLQPEPAFRLGRQGHGKILEGAIFLWIDDLGRPEAAAQIYLQRADDAPGGKWLHEFTSLSTVALHADQDGYAVWSPGAPGVTFRPLTEAPAPGATPALRLRQMRGFALGFKASRGAQVTSSEKGWSELRLLPTPIARYGNGKADSAVLDGALFAFVMGTDPEVFLFVEDRPGPNGPQWQYALAPMSCWPVKAAGPGAIDWELPFRSVQNRNRPMYSRFYQLAQP